MSDNTGASADRPLQHRKSRDRAMILPLVGLFLLTPPLASIFELDTKIAGVPFTLVYLFAVWATLIAAAALLSRQLRNAPEDSAEESIDDGSD